MSGELWTNILRGTYVHLPFYTTRIIKYTVYNKTNLLFVQNSICMYLPQHTEIIFCSGILDYESTRYTYITLSFKNVKS